MPRIAQGAVGQGPEPTPPQPPQPPEPPRVGGGFYIAPKQVRGEMIGKLLLQRFSYEEIAQRLGLTHEEVEKQAGSMKRNWESMRLMATAERIEMEIAQLELVRSEAWVAWERSKENSVEKTRKIKIESRTQVTLPNGDVLRPDGLPAVANLPEKNRSTKVSGRDGNPSFLNIVISTSEQIRKLLGIDAPEVKKLQIETNVTHTLSFEELVQMDPTRLAELHRAALDRAERT